MSIDRLAGSLSDEQIAAIAADMDPDRLASIAGAIGEEVDEALVAAIIAETWETSIMPQLAAIQSRAEAEPAREEVRAYYADLDGEEQQDVFDTAISDIQAAVFELRSAMFQPEQSGASIASALEALRALIRDPWTAEGVLLIFRNEQHIDPEYSETMVQYGAWVLRAIGVAILPEVYDEQTVAELLDQFGRDYEMLTP